MTSKVSLTRLYELMDYDQNTGYFTRKITTGSRAVAGHRAGTVRGLYRIIRIDGEDHYEHVLAWFYVTGVWPSTLVDHKSRNSLDNRFSNLRLATQAQNTANRSFTKNDTGFKGVHKARNGRFRAIITVRGRRINIGTFDTAAIAATHYDQKAIEVFGSFAATNQDLGLLQGIRNA